MKPSISIVIFLPDYSGILRDTRPSNVASSNVTSAMPSDDEATLDNPPTVNHLRIKPIPGGATNTSYILFTF